MESRPRNAGAAVTASVVREFMPSRIERELLAQVFHLLSPQPEESEAGRLDETSEAAALATTSQIAWRHQS
jgi:hypothetical protein